MEPETDRTPSVADDLAAGARRIDTRSVRRLGAMATFGAELTAAESIDAITAATRRVVRTIVGADGGAFVEVVGGRPRLASLVGIDETIVSQLRHETFGDDPITDCICDGRPKGYKSSRELIDAYPHLRKIVLRSGYRRYLVVPVGPPGNTLGAIGLVWAEPVGLDDDLLAAMESIAEVVAQALMRVRKMEDERTIAAITATLAGAVDLDAVFDVVGHVATELLGAVSAEVALVSGEAVLRSVATRSRGTVVRWEQLPPTQPAALVETVRTDRIVVLADEVSWGSYPSVAPARRALGIGAYISLPVRTDDRSAALALGFADPDALHARCRHLIDRLVEVTGPAIDRATRLETEREAKRRSAQVRHLTETIPTARGLGEAIEWAASGVVELERAAGVTFTWCLPEESDRTETLTRRAEQDVVDASKGASPLAELEWEFDLGDFTGTIRIAWDDPATVLDEDRYRVVVMDLRTVSRAVHRIALQTIAERQRHLLAQLLAGTSTAWWTWDVETDTVRWSPGVADMLGSDHDATSLDTARTTLEPSSNRRLQAAIHRAITNGEDYELELQTLAGRWIWTKSVLLEAERGQRVHLGLIRDVTDRKEAQLALEASNRRQRNVIDALFNLVMITDPEGAVLDVNQSLLRLAGREASQVIGRRFWTVAPWSTRPGGGRTARDEHDLARRTSSPRRFDLEVEHDRHIVVLDVQIVPVVAASGSIDYLVTSAIDITRRVDFENRLTDLLDRQRAISRRLQEALLPKSLPEVPGYEIAERYEAAESDLDVGGDWFDVFRLGSGKVAIAIGDIVGRGLDAAGATGQLASVTRAVAESADGPAAVVAAVDRFAGRTPGALGASFLYLELDPATGAVDACRAGHMPPVLIEHDRKVRLLEENGSTLLGVGLDIARAEFRFSLSPGSTLLLFTDGLVERTSQTLDVGLERLETLLMGEPVAADLAAFLAHVAASMATDHATSDDVCLLAIRRS